jgi:hypothetical protein
VRYLIIQHDPTTSNYITYIVSSATYSCPLEIRENGQVYCPKERGYIELLLVNFHHNEMNFSNNKVYVISEYRRTLKVTW